MRNRIRSRAIEIGGFVLVAGLIALTVYASVADVAPALTSPTPAPAAPVVADATAPALDAARAALTGRTIEHVGGDQHGNVYLVLDGGQWVWINAATTAEIADTSTIEER